MSIQLTSSEISSICERISDAQIADVQQLVLFIGHAHSGHSLVGALLDAHPDAAISNHLNIPKLLLDHDLCQQQVFKIILFHALQNNQDDAWTNTGYSYQIPSGFQGKTKQPLVIGDKQGGASTRIIRNNPSIVDKMNAVFNVPIKFVQVARHPLDNIAAFAHYWGDKEVTEKHVLRYVENLETCFQLNDQYPTDHIQHIQHDEFVKNPTKILLALYRFVDLKEPTEVKQWTSIVRSSIHRRRDTYSWSASLLSLINERLNKLGMDLELI